MRKFLFISFFLLSSICSSFSQTDKTVKLTGKIFTGENHKPVPFVNIVLYRAKDTTNIFRGAITDIQGNYIFNNIEYGNYYFKISAIGYKTVTFFQEIGNVKNVNAGLELSENNIDEVTVQASRVNRKIDRTEYVISENQRMHTASALGLMKNIPKIKVNDLNHSITTLMGGAVKVLINGLNASQNELVALKPERILRVEFYDFPPARYANSGYAAVINVITKKKSMGGTSV